MSLLEKIGQDLQENSIKCSFHTYVCVIVHVRFLLKYERSACVFFRPQENSSLKVYLFIPTLFSS